MARMRLGEDRCGTGRTEVVNLDRGDPYDVYIGRSGKGLDGPFGNYVEEGQNRYERVERFREAFRQRLENDEAFRLAVEALRGKKLGCFCMPLRCHGMVIVEHLEGLSYDEQSADYVDAYLRKPTRSAPKKVEKPLEPDMFEEL